MRVKTRMLIGGALVGGLLGCKELTGSQQLPAGTQNPSSFNTPAGAVGMWAVAVQALQEALPSYLVDTGLLTDELTSSLYNLDEDKATPAGGVLDARILPDEQYGGGGTAADGDYGSLQVVRTLTTQALGALATYDTGTITQGDPVALRSQLYALQGYAEILLADFFCSGIPLSTLDFQEDYTYQAGSSTDLVYQDALTKLDSAARLASVHDSVGLESLAKVLQGRAWLARGQYDSAAAAVASVPDMFQYQLHLQTCTGTDCTDPNTIPGAWFTHTATVSNREGRNGLPYLSNGLVLDPRTEVDTVRSAAAEVVLDSALIPRKYDDGSIMFVPFTVADGTEARLIQAEANLHGVATGQGSWLDKLNALRATAPIPGTTQPDPMALPQLNDPGTDSARVALLFHERAYWLFVTGHRQGDLRRLLRQYPRYFPSQQQVYPTGLYLPPFASDYGTDVTAPIPGAEFINPKFHGCLSRSA